MSRKRAQRSENEVWAADLCCSAMGPWDGGRGTCQGLAESRGPVAPQMSHPSQKSFPKITDEPSECDGLGRVRMALW